MTRFNRMHSWNLLLVLFLGCFSSTLSAQEKPVSADHEKNMKAGLALFKNSVKAILVKQCLDCHGGKQIKADFDLSSRKALMDSGYVDKHLEDSHLFSVITHESDPKMPFKAPKLPQKDIDQIGQWIKLGAPYDAPLVEQKERPKHYVVTEKDKKFWSFQPLKVTPVPDAGKDPWIKNEIDQFILTELKKQDLTPNPEQTKRKLIRRVYFDTIGLPPTPEEIEAFVNDASPKAYESLVDRLLANEHFGEKWGRHWLDVARFAESHGFEQDYDRKYAFYYRDFVIKALNQNLPYDTFVRWQLAGDELEPDNPLALMATGFIGGGVFPTQITANEVERTRYDALDDMLATTTVSMLGLTIGCARCHDHKYDPFPTKEYYRMLSTFTTTVRTEIDLDLNSGEYEKKLKEHEAKLKPVLAQLKQIETELKNKPFQDALKNNTLPESKPSTWSLLPVEEFISAGKANSKILEDGSVLVSGPSAKNDRYTVRTKVPAGTYHSVRIEVFADKSFPRSGPGRAGNENFSLSIFKAHLEKQELAFTDAKASYEQNNSNLSAKSSLDGKKNTGWAVDGKGIGKNNAIVFYLKTPLVVEQASNLTLDMSFDNNVHHSIGRPRFSIGNSPDLPILPKEQPADPFYQSAWEAYAAKKSLTKEQTDVLFNRFKVTNKQWIQANAKLSKLQSTKPKPNKAKVQICSEGKHIKPMRHHTQGKDFFEETFVLNRGDVLQKQEVAKQGFLSVLMPKNDASSHWIQTPPQEAKTSHRRASMAEWLLDTKQGAGQLSARVMSNRIWFHYLGRGLVNTPNDFGFQGDRPSHPELLDYLADRFIKSGWDMKAMHRFILLSATYRQSSEFRADANSKDLTNQWYWRKLPRRLDAELIRDNLLALSDTLDKTMYGKGTLDENHRRRSIYFTIKRSKLIPTMMLFDAPEPNVSQGRRGATTTAPQALMFLNGKQVRTYTTAFANKLMKAQPKSQADLVSSAFLHALGREPSEVEKEASLAFLAQLNEAAGQPKEALHQPTVIEFAQVIFGLNELIYLE